MVEPNTVASFRPYDVTQFRSRDAAAAVLLANSLDWTVIARGNGPVALVAKDGKQIRVPDNTGIKMDIFRGWVHQIAVHSNGLSITRELVDQIVKATKINRDHARLMYELIENGDDYGPVLEPDPVMQRVLGEPGNVPLPKGTEPYILTREPFKNSDGRETGNAYVRDWSDGHRDYECVICGAAFPSIKSVGSHKQYHIGRNEVPGQQIKHKKGKPKDYKTPGSRAAPPMHERMVQVPEEVAAEAMRTLRVLEQIKDLIGNDEAKQLAVELNEARLRIAKLEGNIRAFRDLLAEDM